MLLVLKPANVTAAIAAMCIVVGAAVPGLAQSANVILSDGSTPDYNPAAEVGETPTSCQENPDNDAVGGTVCGFADATAGAGLQIAERFSTVTSGEIATMKWWGFFAQTAAPAGDCGIDTAPPVNDKWTIRYYLDDGNGFPGDLVAEFVELPAVTRIDTGADVGTGIGPLSVLEMEATFPEAVQIEGGLFYHVEISSNYDFNDCFFCWQVAPPGDTVALQGTIGEPYTVDDFTEYDVAQCQGFFSGGGGQLPPSIALDLIHPPDVDTSCCQFKYRVRNRNTPGFGALTTFYMAIARGNAPAGCEDITDITPPVGFTVSFCEDWSNNDIAIFKFDGGNLVEQDSTFGQIRTRVNGSVDLILDVDNVVRANGIRAWGSQSNPGLACGTGAFGPFGNGIWNDGADGRCPFEPIPSLSIAGKGFLLLVVVAGGVYLVVRSRIEPAVQAS